MFDFSNVNKSTAVLEIIILMLVAAVIGFVIAWLYWRRRYRGLEAEFAAFKANAQSVEADLRKQLNALQGQFDQSQSDLAVVTEQRDDLRMVRIKLDTLETKHENLRKEYETQEQNYSALLTRNAGLDSENKAMRAEIEALKARITTLEELEGQNKKTQIVLNTKINRLEKENGSLEAALALCESKDKGQVEIKDTPLKIVGPPVEVGEVAPTKKKTAKAEKASTVKKTSKAAKVPKVKKSKTEVLEGVRSQKGAIDFDLIGTAVEADKDDLKVIKGVGPFIEQKLNALGIYTFAQVSRFNDPLIKKITKILEAFPGRIKRDDWIGQAAELAKGS